MSNFQNIHKWKELEQNKVYKENFVEDFIYLKAHEIDIIDVFLWINVVYIFFHVLLDLCDKMVLYSISLNVIKSGLKIITSTLKTSSYVVHLSKGVPKTPWAQKRPQSDTRDLWHQWWEGQSDPSVDEALGVENASHPRGLGVMRVRPWAMRSSCCEDFNMLKDTSFGGELGDMTIWVGCCPGIEPWNNNGLGVAPVTEKVWKGITSILLA